MDNYQLIDLLLETMTLKLMPRTGWLMRGVPRAESIADHSFGVAFLSLALCDEIQAVGDPPQALDREKTLTMALLHDLGEVRLTDLPASAASLIPPEVKSRAESAAIAGLLAPLASRGRLAGLWSEFEGCRSPEGRLVRDADKLEMMAQCLRYEQAGSLGLDEYWASMDLHQWHYPRCRELYHALRARR